MYTTYYIVIKSLCLSSIQEKAHVSDVIGPQPRQATSLIGQSSVDKLQVLQPLQLSTQLRLATSATHCVSQIILLM